MGIDVGKAKEIVESKRGTAYDRHPFWQPPGTIHERVKFLSEPRIIDTKHGPMGVVDVERVDEKGEKRCMNLSKKVLASRLDHLKPLIGKVLVIVGLGKPKDRKYFDFYVATEEEAVKEGVIKQIDKVRSQTIQLRHLRLFIGTFHKPAD